MDLFSFLVCCTRKERQKRKIKNFNRSCTNTKPRALATHSFFFCVTCSKKKKETILSCNCKQDNCKKLRQEFKSRTSVETSLAELLWGIPTIIIRREPILHRLMSSSLFRGKMTKLNFLSFLYYSIVIDMWVFLKRQTNFFFVLFCFFFIYSLIALGNIPKHFPSKCLVISFLVQGKIKYFPNTAFCNRIMFIDIVVVLLINTLFVRMQKTLTLTNAMLY